MFLSEILFPVAGVVEFLDPGDMFSGIVEVLRSPNTFPHHRVNRLLHLTWRLVGNRIVACALMPKLTRLHFLVESKSGSKRGQFMLPENFVQMAVERPYYTMGSLVWASSMCRDFFHDRFVSFSRLVQRAEMWEAEYLLFCLNRQPFWLDNYQKRIIDKYPRGVESGKARKILYPLRRKFLDAA